MQEQELAHWLLSQKVREWKMGSIINLALQMELKLFLAHRHCQSLMDLRWRGGYPDSAVVISSNHSAWQVFVWAFILPFTNPYLQKASSSSGSTNGKAKRRRSIFGSNGHSHHGEEDNEEGEHETLPSDELLLGALAEAFLLKRYEEKNAIASLEKEIAEAKQARAAYEAQLAEERKRANTAKRANAHPLSVASALAARAEIDRQGSFDLAREPKVGHHAHLERQATLRSLAQVSLKKVGSLGASGANLSGSRNLLMKSLSGSRSIVNKGYRESSTPRVRKRNGFYSVPLVKYLLRAGTHVLFLLLYAEVLTHLYTIDQLEAIKPNLPPLTIGEVVLIAWSLSLGYEHRRRDSDMRALGLSTNLPLKSLVNWAHGVLVIAILLRLSTLIPTLERQWCYTYYQMLVSFDAVLMMCEMFTFMWTSVNFGVLTITLVQMMVDLYLFVIFFSVVLMGFCLALVGLSETAPHEHHMLDGAAVEGAATDGSSWLGGGGRMLARTLRSPLLSPPSPPSGVAWGVGMEQSLDAFVTKPVKDSFLNRRVNPNEPTIELGLVYQPFWAMFAEFDLDELSRIPFGLPLMWVYVLIANIVLVNMCVAPALPSISLRTRFAQTPPSLPLPQADRDVRRHLRTDQAQRAVRVSLPALHLHLRIPVRCPRGADALQPTLAAMGLVQGVLHVTSREAEPRTNESGRRVR